MWLFEISLTFIRIWHVFHIKCRNFWCTFLFIFCCKKCSPRSQLSSIHEIRRTWCVKRKVKLIMVLFSAAFLTCTLSARFLIKSVKTNRAVKVHFQVMCYFIVKLLLMKTVINKKKRRNNRWQLRCAYSLFKHATSIQRLRCFFGFVPCGIHHICHSSIIYSFEHCECFHFNLRPEGKWAGYQDSIQCCLFAWRLILSFHTSYKNYQHVLSGKMLGDYRGTPFQLNTKNDGHNISKMMDILLQQGAVVDVAGAGFARSFIFIWYWFWGLCLFSSTYFRMSARSNDYCWICLGKSSWRTVKTTKEINWHFICLWVGANDARWKHVCARFWRWSFFSKANFQSMSVPSRNPSISWAKSHSRI